MSDGNATAHSTSSDSHVSEAEDKYLVRNPRQIRQLLQSLIDQRALINAHLGGRDQSFPTAVLEVDEDEDSLLLDGSPVEASNRAAEQATHLLCFAQLDRVMVRFRLEQLERVNNNGHVAFRADFPEDICHLQRRELYRLETPIADSPYCAITVGEDTVQSLDLRVVDISGGGMAVTLPVDQPVFSLQKRYAGCVLKLPDSPPIHVALICCNMFKQSMPNGAEVLRVGLRFDELPRGGDSLIQRYIFRIDRQRNARKNGEY